MSSYKTIAQGALAVALLGLTAAPLYAQLPEHLRDYPLATRGAAGEAVAPFFNGWIANEDGSVQMIFGFANMNREEIVDVPLGADNRIEPAQFDGAQPTHFPVYQRRGFVGLQERGVFAVTVPADMAGTEVVWTLTSGGKTYSVPGRATSNTASPRSRARAASWGMIHSTTSAAGFGRRSPGTERICERPKGLTHARRNPGRRQRDTLVAPVA